MKSGEYDVQAGDIVVVGTALHDDLAVSPDGRPGVPDSCAIRRIDYDGELIVKKLRAEGVLVAYANLSGHPDLTNDTGRQEAATLKSWLDGFHERFKQEHRQDSGTCTFNLFAGLDSQDWEVSTGGGATKLTKRKFLPGGSAQQRISANIWEAVSPFLRAQTQKPKLPSLHSHRRLAAAAAAAAEPGPGEHLDHTLRGGTPAAKSSGNRRRIFLVGDQNLIGSETRCDITQRSLPPAKCVGAMLQQHAARKKCVDDVGDLEVVLNERGFAAHCFVGLQTQQVVTWIATAKLDVKRGDVVVIATQLRDNDLHSIISESKKGYDSRDLGRPERMMYDPRQLVEKLKAKGVLIAYAKLCSHPELAYDVAAARQKHKSLENFFVRFEMSKETKGVKFFDLFEGMDCSDCAGEDGVQAGRMFYGLEADRYKLAPQSMKRRWLPALNAQLPMAQNIWKAVVELLRAEKLEVSVTGVTGAAAAATQVAAVDAPPVMTEPETALTLAMTAMGVNSTLMIPLEDGAKIAVTAIVLFLRSSQRIKNAGGLRLFLYTGSAASHSVFEAAVAETTPRDERLVLLPLSASAVCDPGSRPGLGGGAIAGFVHEIDRRGKSILKKESKELEEAAVGDDGQSLYDRTKVVLQAASGGASTVAQPSTAYQVPLPPSAPLGATVALVVLRIAT